MILKLLFRPCTIVNPTSPRCPADATPEPLRIIHAGGGVDCYYMAVAAALIMEKYPQGVLARPDVFQRPRESIVHPDEILTPGQKFFVVPRCTIRKLQSRTSSRNWLHPNVEHMFGESVVKSPEALEVNRDGNSLNVGVTTKSPVAAPIRRRPHKMDTWQPSLGVIDEKPPPTVAQASKS